MERKGQLDGLGLSILIIFIAGVLLVFGIILISGINDTVAFNINSNQENLTADFNDAQTLEQIPLEGSSAIAHNRSWLEFDGINDRINIPNSTSLNLNGKNFTFSIWFKIEKVPASGVDGLYKHAFFGASSNGYQMSVNPNGNFTFHPGANQFSANITSGNQTWTHGLATFNNSDTLLYVNGVLSGTFDFPRRTAATGTSNISIIGTAFDATSFFHGSIDELRVYNISMSQTNITEIFQSGRSPNVSLTDQGLVLWYSFDEAEGTTVNDKSENSNNGE